VTADTVKGWDLLAIAAQHDKRRSVLGRVIHALNKAGNDSTAGTDITCVNIRDDEPLQLLPIDELLQLSLEHRIGYDQHMNRVVG